METFDFNKYTNKEQESPEVENLEDLDSEQKFEEECLHEAEKLELNLQEFRNEIESYGGVDKFKEAMNKKHEGAKSTDETVGEHEIYSRSNEHDRSVTLAIVATAFVALGILIGGQGIEDLAKSSSHAEVIESYITANAGVAMASFAGFQAIKEAIQSRKSIIEAKIQKLKLKMTGATDATDKDLTFD